MFKNYFKIAWRNIWNNKLFSFINLFGLAIGIACCAIIFLYVNWELSYDTYNTNLDRVYRVTTKLKQPKKTEYFAPSSPMMSATIKANLPEVEQILRFNDARRSISYNSKKIIDNKISYADSSLFNFFTFQIVEGDAKQALNKPYSIVLTESIAKKIFGKESAFGKMIQYGDTINLMVTAIIKDIPINTHFQLDAFISRSTMVDLFKNDSTWYSNNEQNWLNCDSHSYILVKENTNQESLQEKINTLMRKETAELKKSAGFELDIVLQPLKDIHLKSHLDAEMDKTNGDINNVYIFIAVAFLILLIACCNFINLSTARSLNRSKEIGLRKVIGANRKQLITQFIGESILFSIMASFLSIILVMIFIPFFNKTLGTYISLTSSLIWLYSIIIISVGILAGLYPAILMSSFSPIQSLKGKISHGLSDIIFRKGLVIFQFSIAIILIIGVTIILQQLYFIQNKNIGLNRNQVVTIDLKGNAFNKSDLLLKELLRNPHVVNGSLNSFSFNGISNITVLPEGYSEDEMTSSSVILTDENFLKTFEIPLVAGRDFSTEITSDRDDAFLVNEAAVKEFGWKTPNEALNKKVEWGGMKNGKVIGVIKDFNFSSLREDIKPLIIHIFPAWIGRISLRLKADNISNTMKEIETTWKGITNENQFDYKFEDEQFKSQYRSELSMKTVLGAFTFLSILVACLGLFGLASFTIKQRFKEIGIRKVLGSSVVGIVKLISKDFLKLVIISFIIAVPIAWYGATQWLQNYAYRIDINIWTFILAGFLAFVIALLTVSIQALKAAKANPIKSLRTE